jgi:hypothetical protein
VELGLLPRNPVLDPGTDEAAVARLDDPDDRPAGSPSRRLPRMLLDRPVAIVRQPGMGRAGSPQLSGHGT